MNPGDLLKMNYPPTILIYGMYGTGKTALASTLSGAYIFDFNRGLRTAATLKDKFFDVRQQVTFDIYRDDNPLKPTRYAMAKRKLVLIVNSCAQGKIPFEVTTDDGKAHLCDAVVVDDLTSLVMAAQLELQKAKGDPMAIMEIRDWMLLENEVTRFLLMLQSLGVVVIVLAHTNTDEERKERNPLETNITAIFPFSATKKHGKTKLPIHFDEIWYADTRQAGGGKVNYRVTGKPTNVIMARTRSSFDMVVHNDIGMVGLLKMIGFDYPPQPKAKG